jgi:hypothetical protein
LTRAGIVGAQDHVHEAELTALVVEEGHAEGADPDEGRDRARHRLMDRGQVGGRRWRVRHLADGSRRRVR